MRTMLLLSIKKRLATWEHKKEKPFNQNSQKAATKKIINNQHHKHNCHHLIQTMMNKNSNNLSKRHWEKILFQLHDPDIRRRVKRLMKRRKKLCNKSKRWTQRFGPRRIWMVRRMLRIKSKRSIIQRMTSPNNSNRYQKMNTTSFSTRQLYKRLLRLKVKASKICKKRTCKK